MKNQEAQLSSNKKYMINEFGLILRLKCQPITRRQILDSSKLKVFADDNFKFYENGRKLSKRVENTVGKGEIARYELFLLFPQCFQTACIPGASKGVIVWEWVKNLHLPAKLMKEKHLTDCRKLTVSLSKLSL